MFSLLHFLTAMDTNSSLLLQCATNLLRTYVPPAHPIILFTSPEMESYTSQILRSLNSEILWTIYLSTTGITHSQCCIKYLSYVIILEDFHSKHIERFDQQVEELQRIEPGNPKGLYLIILMEGDRNTAKEIIQHLWRWKIIDATIMSPSQNGEKVVVYTWFPFKSKYECTEVEDIVSLDVCVQDGCFLEGSNLYPEKVKRNLQSCPLVYSTRDWGILSIPATTGFIDKVPFNDGLEVILFREIAKALNMTPVFKEPIASTMVWGDYDPTINSYTGVIGDAKFGRTNISFAGLPKNYFFEDHVDSTYSYLESGFHWYVRCPTSRERWAILIMTFTPPVWVVLIIAFLIIGFIIMFWAKLLNESEVYKYKTLSGSLEYLLVAFLGMSVKLHPFTWEIRIFFFLWVWSSMGVTIVFQSLFTSFLVNPGLEKQVSSVNELIISSLVLNFDPGYDALFEDSTERENLIISKRQFCVGFLECSKRTALVGDSATILDVQNYDLYQQMFKDQFHTELLCRIPERISPYLISMYMQKGNPLFDEVNKVIILLMEAGFVDWWWKDVVARQKIKTVSEDSEKDAIPYFAFSMNHIGVVFVLLGLGYAVSLCVFLVEYFLEKLYFS
ncbi:Ionotropic receptor [Blattella germanica]|nr:Ionotropic receptor [Blattella germanica]